MLATSPTRLPSTSCNDSNSVQCSHSGIWLRVEKRSYNRIESRCQNRPLSRQLAELSRQVVGQAGWQSGRQPYQYTSLPPPPPPISMERANTVPSSRPSPVQFHISCHHGHRPLTQFPVTSAPSSDTCTFYEFLYYHFIPVSSSVTSKPSIISGLTSNVYSKEWNEK